MIRRILTSSINYDHVQRGMLHAFRSLFPKVVDFDYYDLHRKGVTNEEINLKFLSVAKDFQPDWVWLQVQDSGILDASSVNELRRTLSKTVVTHWTGDLRPKVSEYLSSFCRACHLTLISSTGQLGLFGEAGANAVRYCQVAVDWEEDVLEDTVWAGGFKIPEILFIGNNYGEIYPGTKDRENAIIALMDAKLPVGVVGNGWPKGFPVLGTCKLKEQIHLWKQAKICLSISNYSDVERYYSDRQLVSMLSGNPVVTKSFPGISEEFRDDEVVKYSGPQELPDIMRRLLEDAGRRAAIGRKARSRILKSHTWFNRITDLMPVIEGIRAEL